MMGSAFDPLDFAFRAGQELYKAGLLAFINARRQSRGRAPAAWPSVAPTAADAVWTEGNARLLRYRRDTPPTARTPILLVCSLINRPYVLDLLQGRSVVRRLLDGGHDVWLLDWGTPTPDDARRTLGSYALERLPRAAAAVLAAGRAQELHLLGYCMGGTLALAAVAAERVPVASLVAVATPVDLHDDGLLSTWCRTPGFDPVELARVYDNIPPHVLQPAFKMLDPVGLATKLLHLDGKIEDDDFIRFFLAMETWLEDSVAFPGRAFVEWVGLYRSNALVAGTLALDGTPIDLGRVRCPLFNIVAEGDYITPPASSLALERLAGSPEHKLVRLGGGHIGLSTGRAAHQTLWPALSGWLHAHDEPAERPTRGRPGSARNDASAQQNGVSPRPATGNGAVAQHDVVAAARRSDGNDAVAQQRGMAGARRAGGSGAVAQQNVGGAARRRDGNDAIAPQKRVPAAGNVGGNDAVAQQKRGAGAANAAGNGAVAQQSAVAGARRAGGNGAVAQQKPVAGARRAGGNGAVAQQRGAAAARRAGGNGAVAQQKAVGGLRSADGDGALARRRVVAGAGRTGGNDAVAQQTGAAGARRSAENGAVAQQNGPRSRDGLVRGASAQGQDRTASPAGAVDGRGYGGGKRNDAGAQKSLAAKLSAPSPAAAADAKRDGGGKRNDASAQKSLAAKPSASSHTGAADAKRDGDGKRNDASAQKSPAAKLSARSPAGRSSPKVKR